MTTNPESTRHVLVVDDEPDMVALLRSLLTRVGYSGAAALDDNARAGCYGRLAACRRHGVFIAAAERGVALPPGADPMHGPQPQEN